MDLKTFYQHSIFGSDISQKIKDARAEFFSKSSDYQYLTGKVFSLDQKDGMISLVKSFRNLAYFVQGSKDKQLMQNMHLISEIGGFFLNFNAFLSTIQMLGTPEQVQYWENLCFQFQIIGGYGQTEMGHGSDVQGSLTRADYDPLTQQFIINSPSPKSGKYWPGMLGVYGTHCVLQAQTYVSGQHIGIQTFVVPIRDKNNNMKQFPGVEAGDLGPKFGFITVDNGYLYFKDYKIPRENLLMRYCKVEKEGTFKIAGKKAIKLGYGSMLNLRVILVPSFIFGALSSTTLAYHNREPARKYCEDTYKIQQREIGMRDIYLKEDFSKHTCYLMSAEVLKAIYLKYKKAIETDDPNVLQILAEIHILSAGFKACSAWATLNTVRQNVIYNDPIGGLNWSTQSNRLSYAFPATTYEGDNHVLLQQTGKYLLKVIMTIKKSQLSQDDDSNKSKQLFSGELQFLAELALKKNPVDILHNLNLDIFESVQQALEMTLYLYIEDVATGIYKQMTSGEKQIYQILHEINQDKIVDYSKFMIQVMNIRYSKQCFNSNKFEERSKKTIESLLHLNLLNIVEQYKSLMFTYHMANASKLSNIHQIRNQCYANLDDKFLVDSFDNPVIERFKNSNFDEFYNESKQIETSLQSVLSELAQVEKSNPNPRL